MVSIVRSFDSFRRFGRLRSVIGSLGKLQNTYQPRCQCFTIPIQNGVDEEKIRREGSESPH